MMRKKINSTIQFKGGIAVLPTQQLRHVKNLLGYKEFFDYERNGLPENPFHGNLLWKTQGADKLYKRIPIMLAGYVQEVIPPTSE